MTEPTFKPAKNLSEALPLLRRPYTPEAVKFKVQSVFEEGTGCLIVGYVDARLVSERLNMVAIDWSASYSDPIDAPTKKEADRKLMWCHLSVLGSEPRSDVGESSKGMSKDLVSDAFKRAAVHYGVAVSIYAVPQISLFYKEGDQRLKQKTAYGKKTLALTEYGHSKLREGYSNWLEVHGRDLFGDPLDHGDVEGATFDEDEVAVTPGLGDGHGNGVDPGWAGVSPVHAGIVSSIVSYADSIGYRGLGNLSTVKMKLANKDEKFVGRWIQESQEELEGYSEKTSNGTQS